MYKTSNEVQPSHTVREVQGSKFKGVPSARLCRLARPRTLHSVPEHVVLGPTGRLPKQEPSTGTDKETFQFPPSVQIDLFNYLKPKQRAAIRPYLRLIKSQYQEKLCVSLLDYLEGNGLDTLTEPVLAKLQEHIIEECSLRPLTGSRFNGLRPVQGSREPKSIGSNIKNLFPNFSNVSNPSNT